MDDSHCVVSRDGRLRDAQERISRTYSCSGCDNQKCRGEAGPPPRLRHHDAHELGAPGTLRAAIVAAPAWLIALALPKCPLCVAALLTSLGVGATLAAGLADWLQPLVLLWAIAGALLLCFAAVARRRFAPRNDCKHA